MPGETIIVQQVSIQDGQSRAYYLSGERQYQFGIAIDPEALKGRIASGALVPIAHSKFSGTEIDGYPLYILGQPHSTNYYVITTSGKLHSFDNTHAMRATDEAAVAFPISLPDAQANGAAYHDNYLYISEADDITRYGPFYGADGDASDIIEDNSFWTADTITVKGATGSYTIDAGPNTNALGNPTTAQINGVSLPKHPLRSHEDSLLIGDFNGGVGLIHRIKMVPVLPFNNYSVAFTAGLTVTGGTSGATATILVIYGNTLALGNVQGTFQNDEQITDTGGGTADVDGRDIPGAVDIGSAYGALRLPARFIPAAIESFGTDVAIAGNYTASVGASQGNAELILWDNFGPAFHNRIKLPDPIVTALKYHNGVLLIWSGNGRSGYRVSQYLGGQTVKTIWHSQNGFPPFEGAISTDGDRVIWPHNGDQASISVGGVASLFGNTDDRPVFHQIARPSDADARVSCVAATEQEAATSRRTIVIGWGDGSTYGLDEPASGGTYRSVFRSRTFVIGREFRVISVKIPLGVAIASNMSIVPKLFVDGENSSETLTTINNSNFTGSERIVTLKPKLSGHTDFFLELTWSGTAALPVLFPITFVVGLQQT